MERVCKFLKEADVYYLATVEGDQPRVRPFGTVHIFEGKLYIQTGKVKPVSKQLAQNPKAEICAFKDGAWLRLSGELDHSTAAAVRAEVDELILDPRIRRLVFDLDELEFMDSSGIGLIIGRYKQMARRGGTVAVMSPRRRVDRIFEMAGLYQLVERLA